jgi:thioesterase domain-containing protein
MKFSIKTPQSPSDFKKYYQLRWQILRKPWQQPLGSEQDELETQACHRMIVDDTNNVVAVGRFHKTSQHHAQIRYMAVANKYQRQSLGKKIMQALELAASQQGVNEISLNAREKAIAFYQMQGYQKKAFSHQLYNEIDHFLMTKQLTVPLNHQQALAQQLQDTWHKTIPLSKAMNIKLSFYDGQSLLTHCEPSFNKNLHNTMFAGSIYTLATLTGWAWVYMQIEQANLQQQGDTVLAEGNIRYLAPITEFAYAKTTIELATGDTKPLNTGKKARFNITVEVYSGDNIAALFTGRYVVVPKAMQK